MFVETLDQRLINHNTVVNTILHLVNYLDYLSAFSIIILLSLIYKRTSNITIQNRKRQATNVIENSSDQKALF
jgi:hypothetical protein